MAKPTSDTETIESLLEQRAQYEQWLTKLDAAANNAPAAVRQKVRGDYEARLRGVIDRLRGHAATISGELERYQGSQADLDRQRRQAEEELAEAEVRHAVGEYTEEEWQQLSRESQGRLGGLREQLGSVGNEIARLAEVQSLISGPARAPEPAPAPAPRAEVVVEHSPPPPPPPPAEPDVEEPPVAAAPPSRPVPRPAPRQPEPAPVDELAFLKSVADDELKPASRRASNPGVAPSGGSAPRAMETASPPAPQAGPPSGAKAGTPGVAKTLKCGECGTLNRPTEWYCERCGAELAGI
jgi:hypothetical protein